MGNKLLKEKKFSVLLYVGGFFIIFSTIIYFIHGMLLFGYILFMGLGLFLLFIAMLGRLYHQGLYKKEIVILSKLTIISILIFILSFFIIGGFMFFASYNQFQPNLNHMVILGAGLKGDQPMLTLKYRLDTSLDFINKNPQLYVIVSGGKGTGESISEAEAMKRYLMNKGVDPKRIIEENQSTSTYENIVNAKEILDSLEKNNEHRVLIVTSNFHLYRAKYFAKQNGIIPYGIPAKTPPYLLPIYIIREYLAIVKAWLFSF